MQKNIEKIISEHFNQRTLKPSSQSFDRLKDLMTLQKLKRRSKFYKVLGLAATFLLFVFVLGIKLQKPYSSKNKVNKTSTSNKIIDAKKITEPLPKIIIPKTNLTIVKRLPMVKNLIKPNMGFNINNKPDIVKSNFLRAPSKLYIKSNIRLSDAELDSLLATASRKINIDGVDSLSIDALQMLYEIEIEINKPLPEKVILSLKSGGKKVKEIINRNNN